MENKKQIYTLGDFMKAPFVAGGPVIEGLISRQELQLLVATAKTGKSYLAINLALQVARGEPFLGLFKTSKSRVLIWQTEVSGARMRERLTGMLADCGYEDIADSIHIVLDREQFSSPEGRLYLIEVLETYKPDLLILDPLYTLHDLDENSSKDMSKFLTGIREIMIAQDVACLLVHHQGKRGEKSSNKQTGHQSRGSSAIADVPDGTWSLDRNDRNGTAKLSFELRNYSTPAPLELFKSGDWWKLVGAAVSEVLHVSDVVNKVIGNSKIKKSELIEQITKEFDVSTRTVESRIKSALEQNRISEHKEGREKIYSALHPKTSQPL